MAKTINIQKDLLRLLLNGRNYKFKKGQILADTESSSSISLVTSGYVKRFQIMDDGSISIQSIYGPGKIFPITFVFKALLNQEIYSGREVFYYEAMTNGEIYKLSDEDLVKSVENDPSLYKDLLAVSGIRLHSNIHLLENMALRTFYNKLAHQLVFMAREFGKPSKSGIRIDVPLTHSDLASILGATRETVSNSIGELRDKHLIKTANKFITVLDINKLEDEAYSFEDRPTKKL